MANDRTDTPAPSLLLDRYRIEGLLGEGGLGTVYKAFDTRLKRMVAIKTLKRDAYTSDPDRFRTLEERFAREAEAGSRMGMHPNLVAVYDLIIDPDRTQYLVLEYVPGGSLADRLKFGPLPASDALRLTAEVARGLHAAHKLGLVHRDIKPGNIFLSAENEAKVGDFGIAQIDDLSHRTHTVSGHPGTPLYTSPEQERMTAYLRPASDQYSLGLVLFEMLTGQVYKRIGERQAEQLLSEQPAPVAALVRRMLAEEPDDRYPAMDSVGRAVQAIEQAWESVQEDLPVPPPPPVAVTDQALTVPTVSHHTPRIGLQPVVPASVPSRPETGTRYSRRAVLIGGAGLVLAAGTAGAMAVRLRETGSPLATATAAGPALTPTTKPTVTPRSIPTATNAAESVGHTAGTAAVVITAPPVAMTSAPVVITATPLPTTPPTPIAPPTVPPATAAPAPPPRGFTVAASEIGLSANVLEQPTNTDLQTEDNIVKKYFIFSRSTLGLLLFRGESGGDTLNGWYRTQKVVLNVSTTRNIALASAADGRKGYIGEVAGVCDAAETKCVGCSFTDQGVVCPSNTGLATPIHWYHVILAAQAPGGIIVADYFCNLANKSSRDCYTEALSILPSMRVIGPPANR